MKRSAGSTWLRLALVAAALAWTGCQAGTESEKARTETPAAETPRPESVGTESPAATAATPQAGSAVRIRKEWHSLSADEKNAYAQAVRLMLSRPQTDPRSWLYQANMHGYPPDNAVCPRPTAPPQPAWATCQHGQFFFLAWHRMYLYYFEQIVQAAVRQARNNPDYVFNLPFWDYENAAFRRLPAEFRTTSSSLYVQRRAAKCNNGQTCLTESEASATEALKRIPFCNCPAGSTCAGCTPNLRPRQTFGGQFTPVPNHGGSAFGELESQPHNIVHTTIGGRFFDPSFGVVPGWMGDPDCAARDPIFWLHHANIDRLWQKWLNQGNRFNPLGSTNWKNQKFTFFDANGRAVQMTGCQILNMATQLGYQYQGVPVNNVQLCTPGVAAAPEAVQPPPRLARTLAAGASREVQLGDAPVSVSVAMPAEAAARLESVQQVWLVVEGLKQLKEGAYYQVYIDLPQGQKPDPAGPHFVGNISLFGTGGHHDGQRAPEESDHTFDITDEVEELRERNLWSGDVRVTFVQGNPESGAAATEPFLTFRRILIEER